MQVGQRDGLAAGAHGVDEVPELGVALDVGLLIREHAILHDAFPVGKVVVALLAAGKIVCAYIATVGCKRHGIRRDSIAPGRRVTEERVPLYVIL